MANNVTITGIKYGTTTITASYTDGGVTKTASVSNFQVTAIAPTLSFTANSSTLTYSGSAQTIGTISYNGDGTAYYYVQKADSQPSTPAANASSWVEITSWTRTSGGTKQLDLSQTNAGTYYVFLKATGATGGNYTGVDPKQGGNKAINKRTVNVTTAPTFVSTTLTYNGSAQTLVNNDAASTSSAGTFYYYVSTSSTAPTLFSTSTWSTTRPSGTNAGDYYVWYYCLVDTTNNTAGTNANSIKALADSKKNIGKKSATVTAPSDSKVYDDTALTKSSGATLSGQISGHTLNSVTYGGSITNKGTTNCTVTNAKIYSGSTDVTSNYTISYVNGTLEITARPIKVTAGSDSKTYDGTALKKNSATAEATGTNRGLVSGHSMDSCTVTGSQTTVGSSNNVPSAAVIKSGSTDVTSNYNISYVNGTLTVNVRTVTITTPAFNSTSLTYNGSAQAVVNTGSCTAGGTMYYYLSTSSTAPTSFSTESGSGWSTSKNKTNAGTYYGWYYCQVTDTTNNTGTGINTITQITSPSTTKEIAKKAVTVTGKSSSKVYDGSALTLSSASVANKATLSGQVSGHTLTAVTVSGSITNVGSTNNVPSAATISDASSNNVTSNYTITYANGTLTVTAKEVELVWGTLSWTYDGSAHSTTCTVKPTSLVGSDTCTVTLSGNSITNVGSTTVTASSLSNGNYKLPSANTETLTVSKRTVNVTTAPTFVSTTLTYSGSNQTLVNSDAASTGSAGTFYYYVSTSSTAPTVTAGSVPGTGWSTSLPTGKNAGDYYVWYYCYVETTNNTAGTNTNAVKALADSKKNIGQKEIGLSWGTSSWTYDGSTHSTTCSATGVVSGDTCTVTLSNNSVGKNVGSQTVTTSINNSNYKLPSTNTKTISVTAKEVELVWGTLSWTYNGSAHSTTCTVKSTSLVGSDTCTVTLSGNSITNVGSTTVTASSLSNGNYKLPSAKTATLTVTARTVTITAPTFNSSTLTYNKTAQTVASGGSCTTGGTMYYYISTTNSTPTFSTASGSGWSTTTPITATNAGTYYVWYYCQVTDTTNNTGTGINEVTKVSGSKAINQKTATLSWGTKSWMYDGSAHSTTCSVSNLESGDSCTVTLSGNSITSKGSTTVTATALSNSNYALPSATADKSTTIEITARTVTYTADNQSKTYNGSVLTANNNATRSGNELVSGHTATITCTGEIGPGVSSGTKTLSSVVIKNGSGTDVSSNYSITKVNGTLSIVAAAVTVPTATGTEVTYDGDSHFATFPAVSGATITKYQKSLDGGSTWTDMGTSNPARVSAGTTQVKAQYTADGNHSIGGTTGGSAYSNTVTIKINPKTVTVTAGSSSRAYNGSALTNTNATATGLISGHHLHSWTCTGSQTYVGSSDNVASTATIYEGTHNGTESDVTSNYTITYTKGTLTITQATPTVTVTGITKDYTGGSFYATAKANAIGTLYWKKGSAPTASSNDGNVKLSTLNTATNVTYVKDNQDDFDMYWLFVPSSTDNITSGQSYAANFTNAGGGSSDKVNLTINPRDIVNVTASATAVTYNGSQQTASVTVTDSGATITSSDYTISGNTGTYWQDGGYTITITGKNNYTGTKTINWTINKKAITVTAGSASKPYDGSALTKVDGTTTTTLGSGDHLHSYTNTGSQTNVGSSNNVPSAAKIYKGTHNGTESDVTSSYSITYANGTLTVTQRTVTFTAPTFTTGTLTYNGSEQTILTAGSSSAGGTMYYYISTSSTKPTWGASGWTTTAPTKRTDAGTYYVWYYCSVSDTTNNTGTGINTVTAVSGNSRTIGQRTVTFTAPTKTNRTYTGNPQTIFASGSATSGGVMYYSSSNTDFSTSTWSTTMPYTQKTDAGTYTIYYYCYVADTANNIGTGINAKNSISATIGQATGSITYTTYASLTEPCTTEPRAASTMQGNRTVAIASAAATSSTNTGAAISYTTNRGWACNGTTLTIPSGTEADTYTVVVTATVEATDNYSSASTTSTIEITIDAQVLIGITLTLAANSIAYNSTTTGTVMATYLYGEPVDITASATYTSNPTGIVNITK